MEWAAYYKCDRCGHPSDPVPGREPGHTVCECTPTPERLAVLAERERIADMEARTAPLDWADLEAAGWEIVEWDGKFIALDRPNSHAVVWGVTKCGYPTRKGAKCAALATALDLRAIRKT